jgi:intracellular multiplication protein IcmJ
MLLPLQLGARRKSGSNAKSEKTSARIVPKDIWRHDDYVCQFCGFRSEKFQRVVLGAWCDEPRAGLTACPYCEQCMTLETTGSLGGGSLIYLPDMAQTELNHLCRAIHLGKTQSSLHDRAQTAWDALVARRAEAKKRLGMDDPVTLGVLLLENLNDTEYAARHKKLAGIRYLPPSRYMVAGKNGMVDQFPAMLDYWQSSAGPFGKTPIADWLDRFVFA